MCMWIAVIEPSPLNTGPVTYLSPVITVSSPVGSGIRMAESGIWGWVVGLQGYIIMYSRDTRSHSGTRSADVAERWCF